MLTMMIFSFVALREPARLARYTAAVTGRTIENGGLLFKNNCVSCHGTYGEAQKGCSFVNEEGVETGLCRGLALNNPALLCGDYSTRMDAMNTALSKEAFIRSTIAAGRGQVMPMWSSEFGGPLLDHEIDQLTAFVLNWEPSEAACEEYFASLIIIDWAVEYPSVADLSSAVLASSEGELEPGDPERGQQVFAVTGGCQACHGDPQGDASTAAVGPWQGNIAEEGATKIEGYTAADYLYESILNPNAYIAEECPTGPCAAGVMPQNFATALNDQQMADLLAYLLGDNTFESTANIRFLEE
ncbi:MAG TPA: c-type cytochrome [Anaerolineae bacterium]|nr:c-type cytochrome [Anaerolineae bacterium]